MKESQTFKLDPQLLIDLKKEARILRRPFNNYVEIILFERHTKIIATPKKKSNGK